VVLGNILLEDKYLNNWKFLNNMRKMFTKFVELFLGLALIVFGANGFLQFMPAPEFNAAGSAFLGALFATGYVFPLMSLVWIIAGVLLVIRRARAFAVVAILPISLNLVLFHIFLDSAQGLFSYIILVANLYLVWAYFKVYRPLFS